MIHDITNHYDEHFNFGHPQRIALERIIIGSLLIDTTKIHVAQSNIKADDFFHVAHRLTFECMMDLYVDGKDVDIMSTWQELKNRNMDEQVPIAELVNMSDSIGSTAHFDTHCHMLREWSLRSHLWKLSAETIRKINDNTHRIDELLNDVQLHIGQMTGRIQHHNDQNTESIITDMWSEIQAGRGNGIHITDIPAVNNVLGGSRPGDLIVIAGRPGSGKSVTTSNIMRRCIQDGRGCMLWSLEMDKLYIMERFIAMMSHVDHSKITDHKYQYTPDESDRVLTAEQHIKHANIHIVERPGVSALEIRSEIIFQNATGQNIDTLIIDHGGLLQHINPNDQNTVEQIGNTTKLLKQTAQELKIRVVLLWQLNRQASKGVEPSLSDLRGSGRIEEDADKVMFVHRPELYAKCPETIEFENHTVSTDNLVQFFVAKNRRGAVGHAIAHFERDQYRFRPWDPLDIPTLDIDSDLPF